MQKLNIAVKNQPTLVVDISTAMTQR